MIDPTFKDTNRLFVLSKMVTMILQENSFDKKYMSLVEIRDFSTIIDNRPFSDYLVKNKQAYEKLSKISINDDYTAGNLFHYLYHEKPLALIYKDE